jgi:predicted nucleic acid-binding protein
MCSPVAQEILQGIKDDFVYESILENIANMPMVSNPIPYRMYREAAEIYRNGRKHGLTIRSSIDCLIAAIAIEHKLPVMHNDRDFTMIAEFTSLHITTFIKT